MRHWEKVLYALSEGDEPFRRALREALEAGGINLKEFARKSGVPASTLYKLVSNSNCNMRLSSVRDILKTLRSLERKENEPAAVALIADRSLCESMQRTVFRGGKSYVVKGYPAVSIEDAFVQGVLAERDGVEAIICGPISAYTLEKIVRIPVIALRPDSEQVKNVLENAIRQITD